MHKNNSLLISKTQAAVSEFHTASVLGYYADGKLKTWLEDRYYDDQAAAVSALTPDMPDLKEKLCAAIGVEYKEEAVKDIEDIQRRNEKLRILSSFTADREILDNVDLVAMDQDDLFDILDMSPSKVYLYSGEFSIPFGKKNICYIGLNQVTVRTEKDKLISDYYTAGITFQNVDYADAISRYYTVGEALFIKRQYREAFPLLEEAANKGNPRAMFLMARYYNDCYNVVKYDDSKRDAWLKKAMPYQEPISTYYYTIRFLDAQPDEQKRLFEKIAASISKMAKNRDRCAQLVLGNMYRNGEGVERDENKAVKWYRKAAEQGDGNAQYNLGLMYEMGRGIYRDEKKAVKCYRRAAEQGLARAQLCLGLMYECGTGVEQDDTKAAAWYRKAAEQGDPDAQCNLGVMYEYGTGVEQDETKAVAWYRKAAEQGYARAQCNLGVMYEFGTGVEQDETKAVTWYRKAAEQGYAPAQCNLGVMYKFGTGVEQDETKAVAWYRKAAEQGDARAQFNLGDMYECGRGIEQDETKAVTWYRKAAEQGYAPAQWILGVMYARGTGIQKNEKRPCFVILFSSRSAMRSSFRLCTDVQSALL